MNGFSGPKSLRNFRETDPWTLLRGVVDSTQHYHCRKVEEERWESAASAMYRANKFLVCTVKPLFVNLIGR